MLRVKRWVRSLFRRQTLIMVIGARQIECGIIRGDTGTGGQWISGSLLKVSIQAEEGESAMDGLCAALEYLKAVIDHPAVNEMRVVIADNWLAVAGIPWSDSLKRSSTAEAYARNQLFNLGFDVPEDDLIRIDAAPYDAGRMVVAYPSRLLDALTLLSSHLRARLASVIPLSVAAGEMLRITGRNRPRAMALLDTGLMIITRGNRQNDITIRTGSGAQAPNEKSMRDVWQRICLREPQLFWLDIPFLNLEDPRSEAPSANPFIRTSVPMPDNAKASAKLYLAAKVRALRHSVDATPGHPSGTPMRLMTATVAVSLVLVTLALWGQANFTARTLKSQLDELIKAEKPAVVETVWTSDELIRIPAVNAAIRELNMPIYAILRALEPPEHLQIAILSIDASGENQATQSSSIKITAEARTTADMAYYVAYLGARKPFVSSYLINHEIVNSSGEQAYRFTMEALWNE